VADFRLLERAIVDGAPGAGDAARSLLGAGATPHDVVRRALLPAVDEVGLRAKEGSYSVLDVVRSVRAVEECLQVVRPEWRAGPLGVVVIGTPKGEIHDLGKQLMALLLRGAGFEVHDVGTDVMPRAFVGGVVEHHATMVAMSALLTTTIPSMQRVVEELVQAGLRGRVKVLIGGTAVRADRARKIGADAGCQGLAEALECAWALAGVTI
jgi:5-methyltetrahydrofolate--homocysteine methyltransferase